MMNKKMGAEAWGAAELGSAAPMGAAAMGSGGGSTRSWTLWLEESEVEGQSAFEARLQDPMWQNEIKVVYDGKEYIVPRIYGEKGAYGYAAKDFTVIPCIGQDGKNGTVIATIIAGTSGKHTIEIYVPSETVETLTVYQGMVTNVDVPFENSIETTPTRQSFPEGTILIGSFNASFLVNKTAESPLTNPIYDTVYGQLEFLKLANENIGWRVYGGEEGVIKNMVIYTGVTI